MAKLDLMDQPFPKSKRFGVGVVDPEDLHSLFDPEQHDVAERVPQRAGVLGRGIRVNDILVFLGRIFRIAYRSIRPSLEPLRMVRGPGMIERALNGEVKRVFHLVRTARYPQLAE